MEDHMKENAYFVEHNIWYILWLSGEWYKNYRMWKESIMAYLKVHSPHRLKRIMKKKHGAGGLRADIRNRDLSDTKQGWQSTATFSRTSVFKHTVLQLIGYANQYSKKLQAWQREFDSRRGLAIFLFSCVQNGSGAHPAFYPMDIWGDFPGGKATGAWSWPLTSA
jgi:hypothetical protein